MSSYADGGGPSGERKDPLVRFVLGCAAIAAVVALIVIFAAFVVGWRLTRDETAGRSLETFLIGDETRYWSLDVRADDPGLIALSARFDEINESTRRSALKGTVLESLPLPHRPARLDQLAPCTFEIAVVMSAAAEGPSRPTAWAARATMSHGMLRLRAALKMMRWISSRDPEKAAATAADGVDVTEIHDKSVRFAVATVGNRVLVASDASRLGSILRTATTPRASARPGLSDLHATVKLDGEDAWAYIADARIGDLQHPLELAGAAASFDVNDRDELVFRAAVLGTSAGGEGGNFGRTKDDCVAVASAFLPGVPAAAIEIDETGADATAARARTCTGRVPGLSKLLGALLANLTEIHIRQGHLLPPQPETPSATPNRPSPALPYDRRTGTPSAPPREGNPKPPR